MRLVASPQLSEVDIEAITSGLSQRDSIVEAALTRELLQEFEGIVSDRLACLSWLLAHNRLEIKIVVLKDLQDKGIYHEKMGLFIDTEGNKIAFGGSANESARAYQRNFECINTFLSWQDGDSKCIDEMLADFEDLWHDRTPDLDVMEFPDAAKCKLLEYCPEYPPEVEQEFETVHKAVTLTREHHSLQGVPMLPQQLILRDYQEEAVANWFKNKGRGTLKMATGSGKTITALAITAKLYERIQLEALIVVCPYRHLVQQWKRECEKFGLKPILAYESLKKWQSLLSNQLINRKLGLQPFVTVITTNATLTSQGFQSQLGLFPKKTLLIGDEAHNLGAERLALSLPKTIGLRLGLSATPERYFDDRGTQALFDYFGSVLKPEFTLKDAIEQGTLVNYRYYPILVELTEEEAIEYAQLSVKIGKAIAIGGEDEDNENLTLLLSKRARLIGAAGNKITALRELMKQRLNIDHTLFYCGDGSVEDTVTQETLRQLEVVTRLLGSELGYRVNTYTAETSLDEREDLRQQFETGELQGLVAIRCLDEGVDIPAIQTAVILASSSNPRQFVQRRGRILRRHPNKQRAELFDMIVIPPDLGWESLDVERTLLEKELQRFAEFADLADNAGEARIKLLPLQDRYGLMDI
ncbi:DNA phosphorothioation system restriction enzyme [Synechococcus moorigangaii CMS01]|nr:DNA phosphorothioation system restriction enzyme [Synechococcus moorigangaii CMS01]